MVASPATIAALIDVISERSGKTRLLRRELENAIGIDAFRESLEASLMQTELTGCPQHGVSIAELEDGNLYCDLGGHVVGRDDCEVADLGMSALITAFGQHTGTSFDPNETSGDLVLMTGNLFDIILCFSDRLISEKPNELVGLHMLTGKPLKAYVSKVEVPQLEPFGVFRLDTATAVGLGKNGTARLPDTVSRPAKLGGETWRQLYESFRDAGISPDLELMCAAVQEASAVGDLARVAASGEKAAGAQTERLLYLVIRRAFPHSLPLNPAATGRELPDGYIFTVHDPRLSCFYDSKARVEDYSLVASERRKLDTYFERSVSTLQTHELSGGCLVSTAFDPVKVSSGGQALVAKHNLPLALITFEGLQRLAAWDLHPVLGHLLRIVRQPEPNSLFVQALFRPETLSAQAGALAGVLDDIRHRFVKLNPSWAELSASRVFYWSPSLLLTVATTVALVYAAGPIEAELQRFELMAGRPAISTMSRLKEAFPPKVFVDAGDWSTPLTLDFGAILPLEPASVIATMLTHQDRSYERSAETISQALTEQPER